MERGANDYPGEQMSLFPLRVSSLLKIDDEFLRFIVCYTR